ncbi:MAG: hypothetical protein AAF449_15485, partial [Myxococcota bacterium]
MLSSLLLAASIWLSAAAGYAQTAGVPMELDVAAAAQRAPAVSYDADNDVYVMVWEDRRNEINGDGVDLYLARIRPDGSRIDTFGLPLLAAEQAGDEILPAIEYNPAAGAHIIAWNEARASTTGLSDIYVSLFSADSGMISSDAGQLINGGAGSKGPPSLAVGAASSLVTFDVVFAGQPRVRAVRLAANLAPLDAGPITINLNATRPDAIFSQNQYAVAYESVGDIFVRSVPDFGSTSTIGAAQTVVAAPLSQSRVRLGRHSPGEWTAVWQDGRTGGDRLAYARRFSNAVLPVAPETRVQTSTSAQLDPKISGDDRAGLIVWQDRRQSSGIFGARVNANGTIVDPGGLPLINFVGTAFEPAVAKGPGRDYLVAAVRFDLATPRIFYRIVRDEAPEGQLTFVGPTDVRADGIEVATLNFGTATGPADTNGVRFNVIDGTQYDVALSSNNPRILTPDVNPSRPGHQLATTNGMLQLQVSSITREMVDIMVSSVVGNSSGIVTLSFTNIPPVASNVVVGPVSARSDQSLQLRYDFSDVNGDLESASLLQWLNGTQIVDTSTLADPTRLPATFTRRGERWTVRVTPRDGLDFGQTVRSNEVNIINTPPDVIELRLVGQQPTSVRTGSPLEIRFRFVDVDGDARGPQTQIQWQDNLEDQPDITNAVQIPGDRVVKGQSWQVAFRPHDGFE